MNVSGLAMDRIEAIAGATDDPESRPAGCRGRFGPPRVSCTPPGA